MNQFGQSETDDSIITIKEYVYLFWSWAWLIILFGVLAGVFTNRINQLQADRYAVIGKPPPQTSEAG